MKHRLLFPVSGMVVMLIAGFMRCTTGPTAGTETGNPDITACLTTALSMFDSVDAWLPSTYLVEGEQQLDPGKVYTASPDIILAKRRALAASTASDTIDSGSRTFRVDTFVVVDTIFVDTVIVSETMVQDTVAVQPDEDSSSALLITQRVRYDSLFLVDTVLRRDTFYLYMTGSGMTASTGGGSKEYSVDSIAKNESIDADYVVVRDSASGSISLFEIPLIVKDTAGQRSTVDAEVRSDSAFTMVARQLTIGDVFVSETYRDADGDGFLATAASGANPLSTGIVARRRGTRENVLQVDFDAGSDNLFGTIGDNRIHALLRTCSEDGAVVDRVHYGPLFFGEHGDTVFLQRDRATPDDSFSQRTDRYICITGDDPIDHRGNLLAVYTLSSVFRNGAIEAMEISVSPEALLSKGQSPTIGIVRATVNYGKGLTGIVEASIDYASETIDGIYAEAGVEYRLTYRRNGNSLELLPLQ
ncbi:MAG: hypothetical protein JXA18_10135 [Chitinispirillaceae bacterium]|nr:hypothetical protein [Chitinispirillaceae bacterium]